MIFEDYSPVDDPSLRAQEDALQKGLGRSVQWASSRQLSPEVLLDACVNDKRYDRQCEDNRGDWLWEIMCVLGVTDSFRDPLKRSLESCIEERHAYQLCDLIYRYAMAGDKECEKILWRLVEQRPVPDCPSLGEGQLLKLRGLDAFRVIARVRGRSLKERTWDWDDDAVTDRAIEVIGKEEVGSLLASSADPDVCRFATLRKENQTKQDDGYLPPDPQSARSAGEVIETAEGNTACQWFRSWGMRAEEADLKLVLSAICDSDDPKVVVRLLRVFSNRSLPVFDSRTMALCQHNDEDVRRNALRALANSKSEAVRNFANQQLLARPDGPVVRLFTKNLVAGDEQRILAAIVLPEDQFELHSLLIGVLEVLEANPESDPSQLGLVVYGSTPCQICRLNSVKILLNRDAAPSGYEMRFNSTPMKKSESWRTVSKNELPQP